MATSTVTLLASGTSTTATTTVPFSAQPAGTLLVLTYGGDDYRNTSGANRPESSGWTLISDQHTFLGHAMWYKIATGSETSVAYTIGSASPSVYQLLAADNIAGTSPLDVSNGQFAQSFGNSYDTPAVTTSAGDRLAIGSLGGAMNGTWSGTMTGWTNSFTHLSTVFQNVSSTKDLVGTAYLNLTGGGSTSTTANYPQGPIARTGIIAVFKVAAGSGGTTYDVSGTVAASSSSSGAVSRLARTLAVAGTIAALSSGSGDVARVPQVQPVTGTVAASSSTSGDVTRVGATQAVSGTAAAVSGSSGAVTRVPLLASVSGTVAALSSSSGDVSRVGATPTVSGTVVATSGTQGAVSSLLQVGGTVAAVSGSSGDATRVPRTLAVSGTIAAASATSLGVSVVGGPQTYPVAATVAATSTSSGALQRIRAAVAGTVAASSSSSGAVDVLRAPVTWQVAGTIPATSGSLGAVVLIAQASGTVGAVSGTSGNVFPISPTDATANPAARLALDPTPTLSLDATPTLALTMTRPEVTLDNNTATVADTAPLTGKAGTDLTGASVEAHVKLNDGTVTTLTTNVTDAATGAWSAAWPAGGVPDVPGVASVELAVTYSDTTDQTLGPVVFSIRSQYA